MIDYIQRKSIDGYKKDYTMNHILTFLHNHKPLCIAVGILWLIGLFMMFVMTGHDFLGLSLIGIGALMIFYSLPAFPALRILRIVVSGLDAAFHSAFSALGQIFCAKFCQLAPCDNVDKISFTHAIRIGESALHGQGETAACYSAGRGRIFRIPGQISDQDCLIHISPR
jgi:hypothetical protein